MASDMGHGYVRCQGFIHHRPSRRHDFVGDGAHFGYERFDQDCARFTFVRANNVRLCGHKAERAAKVRSAVAFNLFGGERTVIGEPRGQGFPRCGHV